jgi:hypothetical protein
MAEFRLRCRCGSVAADQCSPLPPGGAAHRCTSAAPSILLDRNAPIQQSWRRSRRRALGKCPVPNDAIRRTLIVLCQNRLCPHNKQFSLPADQGSEIECEFD